MLSQHVFDVLRSNPSDSFLLWSLLWCGCLWFSTVPPSLPQASPSGMRCGSGDAVPAFLYTSVHQMFKHSELELGRWDHWSSQVCNSLDSVVVGGRPDEYHGFALILLELAPGSLFLLKGGYLVLSTYNCGVFALYCVVFQKSQCIFWCHFLSSNFMSCLFL